MDFVSCIYRGGSILGKPLDEFKKLYKLDKKQLLGEGGFGKSKTYICKEISTDKSYACKSIPKKKLNTGDLKESVKTEIRILELFPGVPNIVQIKGSYEDKNSVHIVMELCKGGELFDKIEAMVDSRGYYTENDAAGIFKSIMEAIQVIHSSDVIHRDVEPDNFLFSSDDEEKAILKAIDFGCSVHMEQGRELTDQIKSNYYVAPEVLEGKSHGKEVDIWSAGVILYILLSGTPPFQTDHEIKTERLDFGSHLWLSISPHAKNLIKKMLKRNPKKRFCAEDVLEHSWITTEAPDKPIDGIVFARLKQFQAMNKFEKMALEVFTETLPEEKLKELKTIFEEMDTNKGGSITYEEFKTGLHRLGSKISETEFEELMIGAIVNRNGTIEYKEFITLIMQRHGLIREESLRKALQRLEKDGIQYITKDEFEKALKENGIEDEAISS